MCPLVRYATELIVCVPWVRRSAETETAVPEFVCTHVGRPQIHGGPAWTQPPDPGRNGRCATVVFDASDAVLRLHIFKEARGPG
jgi:hypothetical protein